MVTYIQNNLTMERQLLLKIAEGDEQAFAVLHERYSPIVYQFLLAHVKSREIAEEIVYDVFLKIWTGRSWLTQVENFGAFIRVVSKRKALDYLKITARSSKLKRIYIKEVEHAANFGHTADFRLLDKETMAVLEDAIRQLSPQRKQVFLLHREEGYSYEEIAGMLGLTRSTVKSTMHGALDSIRDFLRRHHKDSLAAFGVFLLL